jgi:hypothetical protein
MDIFTALIVVVPLILPIAQAYNIDLIHLGIVFLVNLQIGYITPPVGMDLFIASIRFNKPVISLYRASLVFLGLLLFALAVITYVPILSTWFIEKPSIVGQWEYKDDMGNSDIIYIKAGGKYLRKKGNMIDIMMNPPYTNEYSASKDILNLKNDGSSENYKFEIYSNGEQLMLAKPDAVKERIFYKNLISPPINIKTAGFIGRWKSGDSAIEFNYNGICAYKDNNGEIYNYRYRVESKNKIVLFKLDADENESEKNQSYPYVYKFENDKKLILKDKNSVTSYELAESINEF